MKVEGKPIRLGPNSVAFVKSNGDGTGTVTRVDDIGDSREAHKRMQAACKSRTDNWRNLESGPKRLVATMPEQAHEEMKKECGNDPDKQNAWLRDHEEYLTSKQVKQDLPKKRKVIPQKD